MKLGPLGLGATGNDVATSGRQRIEFEVAANGIFKGCLRKNRRLTNLRQFDSFGNLILFYLIQAWLIAC